MKSAKAGVLYFALVFAAGFMLGTVRVYFLLPRMGETGAVAVELPFMLAISWAACTWAVRKYQVEDAFGARLAMGALAFALLLAAELTLGVFAFGRTLAGQVAAWVAPAGALGFAGQVAFALFPLAQRRRR